MEKKIIGAVVGLFIGYLVDTGLEELGVKTRPARVIGTIVGSLV